VTDEQLRDISPALTGFLRQFESHFELVTAAGGIVLNEKKEVLLIYRNEKWDLPKGKAEVGETPEQTGLREVSEETGLQQLAINKVLPTSYHTYKEDKLNYLKTTYWYEMNGSSAEKLVPQAAEKITDIKWIATADLTKYLSATYTSIASLIQLYTG
jgi:8-oxo-dGTP pyrophosphatase MutT (NUDIX family)